MRFLYVYPFCGLGGVETSILNKIALLKKIGIEVEVYFSELYGEGGKEILTCPNIHLGLSDQGIFALLKKNFDYIIVIDYPDFFGYLDQLTLPGKIIFETHISEIPALKKVSTQLNHPQVAAVVVPSEFNKKLVQQYYVGDHDRIFVLPNPIQIDFFKPIPPNQVCSAFHRFLGKKISSGLDGLRRIRIRLISSGWLSSW